MLKDFIKGHPNFILLAIVQAIAIFGLLCGFAGLFMSIANGENAIVWLLCFGLPLLAFVFVGVDQSHYSLDIFNN